MMVKIAYFGHNYNEPAIRRRARAFLACGVEVVGVMPHRGALKSGAFDLVSLGETRDKNYLGRLRPLAKSLIINDENNPKLAGVDMIYARNLDMLVCAHAFRWRNRLHVPIVYECLDIHSMMLDHGAISGALRRLEAALLRRSGLLVYSSDRYCDAYFDVYHPGLSRGWLLENRMHASDVAARPTSPRHPVSGKVRLGWVGNLRCRRSFNLLTRLGAQFHEQLEIHLHGYPARTIFPDFETELAQAKGITYHGRYDSAIDLPRIYNNLDVIWAIDWFEAERNSIWQIPNRIYEGGYYGVPAICARGTETGRKISDWQAGWLLEEPVEDAAAALVASLLEKPEAVRTKSEALLNLPASHFVETPEDTRQLVQELVGI